MRPINFIWIVICLLLGISCRNDDAQFEELWEYVNNMADRLARFEAWQERDRNGDQGTGWIHH
jgi:hypothetical protein